ncbi:hypothetical protein G4G28_14870 [Massilia sp. Dwa41.01b]|uniref:hypothetical protein n=1 Tax=unclassified Massilia TaxID=2609279 RepID=UPI001601B054|nr:MULTISPECIES: hypothetical protein [unclassified Massilia]QNA89432.1 hypothetical protein G4G28_14870 [Massilia sp. Dwa41.01b]QNB00334.1 hypothetical protein G4G31_18450 [Massilia sp. Se16.2.3]
MSRSAFSAKAFAAYLFVLGACLVVVPNTLLSLFGIPPSPDVWVRVVGLTVFMLGVYAWVSANYKPFLEASVYTRAVVFAVLTCFALLDLGSPMLAVFGLADLGGGLWTWFALRADARADQPRFAAGA